MKKYFLLISLFALMFLGLGNYSFGQTPTPAAGDTTTNTVQEGAACPTSGNLGGNSHMNTFGICVCNEGYKKVDNKCRACSEEGVCCGIELNTSIPFIGNCIESENTANYVGPGETGVTGEKAFPVLMGSLSQMLVTIILIVSFVLILIGGIRIATGDPKGGTDMIKKVAIGIAILGASGVILRLINPNFFG